MAVIEIIFLTGIFYFIYILWSLRKHIKCAQQFPGPFSVPTIGNILNLRDSNKFFDIVSEMRNRYGSPFRIWLGTTLFLYSDDPDFFKVVSNSKECISKANAYRFVKDFLGDGILVSEPTKWSEHRKILNPIFSNKILLSFYPILNAEVDKFLKKLDEQVGQGEFNLESLLEPCILDIACQTTMGTKMNFQNGENIDLLQVFKTAKKITGMRAISPWFYPDRIFKLSNWSKISENVTKISQEFVSKMVENKLKERISKKKAVPVLDDNSNIDTTEYVLKSKNIFIDQALHVMEDQAKFGIQDVKDNANLMLGAAFDTTVHGVLYTIVCLAMNPDCQEKVIEEIYSIFPNRESSINHEETKNMIYTEMALNEALRLFPPVPIIGRKLNADLELKSGAILPKGLNLALDILNMHRNEKYWGLNARKYNPENFLPENICKIHPYAFAPFSKGSRNCIGMRYAYNAMKVQLAKIFQKYRFSTKLNIDDFKFRLDITLTSLIHPLVEVHRIDSPQK